MTYQTRDQAGEIFDLLRNARISSINGEPVDYIVDEVKPERSVLRNPRLKTWPIEMAQTTLVDGQIVDGELKTLAGQVKYERASKQTGEVGPNAPCTEGYFLVRSADRSSKTLLRVFFAAPQQAQQYANAYVVQLVTVTRVGANPDAGRGGTQTPIPRDLAFTECYVWSQRENRNGQDVLVGRARIVAPLSEASLTQLRAADYFTIAPNGEPAERYTLSGATDGLKLLANTHVEISLIRKSQ